MASKHNYFLRYLFNHLVKLFKLIQRLYGFFWGYYDYFSFPFDTRQPMPSGAEGVMKTCCEVLESLNIKYFLCDGTLLGLYRDGGFIPHDTDIDVNIIGPVDYKKIHKVFTDLGMTLGRRLFYRRKIQQLIYYTKEDIIFDMVIWEIKGDAAINHCEVGYMRRQSCKYFEDPGIIKFCGKDYPIHSPIEEWLEMRYGPDWRIPKVSKVHWMEECFDLIKLK